LEVISNSEEVFFARICLAFFVLGSIISLRGESNERKEGQYMNTFTTETDSGYVRLQTYKTTLVLFVVLSLLACLGFLIAWQTFLFIELIVLISCVVALNSKKGTHHTYVLKFEDDRLYITDKTDANMYEVFDIPASDFIINQTKQEIKKDYCSLAIKNTIFAFGGVKNCAQLKKYISDNYN
jgi:hypothetical protein